jgi:hypothetical protein
MTALAWLKIECSLAVLACSFVQAPATVRFQRTTIGNMEAWAKLVMLHRGENTQIQTKGDDTNCKVDKGTLQKRKRRMHAL